MGAQQTPTSQHLTTSSTMLKPCLSLIVLVGSTCCSPVNFLGVPGYSQEVISPNIYPLRTALDVLQPGLGYGYGQYGYGYPWALNSFGLGSLIHPSVQVAAPVADSVAVAKDVVDVAVEEIEEDSPSIVTIQEHIDALPTPPQSLFRDPSGPPIPAGIVQATQPKFVQVLFKNPKLSPHLHFISNSKVSPVLQEIKDLSAGIAVV